MNAHNRVMVVDDEQGVRQSWSRFLSEKGFDVDTAPDGNTAIEHLQAHPADVVVSDLRMPGPDGLELLAWIRDHQPDTRFILLTGYGNQQVKERAEELGAFEYLNKPIAPDTLANIVTAAAHMGFIPTAIPAARQFLEEMSDPDLELASFEDDLLEAPVAEAVIEAPVEAEVRQKSAVRSVGEIAFGLVLAPILGLLFVVFLPLLGLGALVWVLGEMLMERTRPAEAPAGGALAGPAKKASEALHRLEDEFSRRFGGGDDENRPPPTQFN